MQAAAAVDLRGQAKPLQRGSVRGQERINPTVALSLDDVAPDPDRLAFVGRLQERTCGRDLRPNGAGADRAPSGREPCSALLDAGLDLVREARDLQ